MLPLGNGEVAVVLGGQDIVVVGNQRAPRKVCRVKESDHILSASCMSMKPDKAGKEHSVVSVLLSSGIMQLWGIPSRKYPEVGAQKQLNELQSKDPEAEEGQLQQQESKRRRLCFTPPLCVHPSVSESHAQSLNELDNESNCSGNLSPLMELQLSDNYLWLHTVPGLSCSLCIECETVLSSRDIYYEPLASDAASAAFEAWQRYPALRQLAHMSGCKHSIVSNGLFGALLDSPCSKQGSATCGRLPFGTFLVGTQSGQVWAYPLDEATIMHRHGEEATSAVPDNGLLLFDLEEPMAALFTVSLSDGISKGHDGLEKSAVDDILMLVGSKGRVVAVSASPEFIELSAPSFQILGSFHKIIGNSSHDASQKSLKLLSKDWRLPFNVCDAHASLDGELLAFLAADGDVRIAALAKPPTSKPEGKTSRELVQELVPVKLLITGPISALSWGPNLSLYLKTFSGLILSASVSNSDSLAETLWHLNGSCCSRSQLSRVEFYPQLQSRSDLQRYVQSAVKLLQEVQSRQRSAAAYLTDSAHKLEGLCCDVRALKARAGDGDKRINVSTAFKEAVTCRLECQMVMPLSSGFQSMVQTRVNFHLPDQGLGRGWKLLIRFMPTDATLPSSWCVIQVDSLATEQKHVIFEGSQGGSGSSATVQGGLRSFPLMIQMPMKISSKYTAFDHSGGWFQALLCRPLKPLGPRKSTGGREDRVVVAIISEHFVCGAQLQALPRPLGLSSIRAGNGCISSSKRNIELGCAAQRQSSLGAWPHNLSVMVGLRFSKDSISHGVDEAAEALDSVYKLLQQAFGSTGCQGSDASRPSPFLESLSGSSRAMLLCQGTARVVWRLVHKQSNQAGVWETLCHKGDEAGVLGKIRQSPPHSLPDRVVIVEVRLSAASRAQVLSLHRSFLLVMIGKEQRQQQRERHQHQKNISDADPRLIARPPSKNDPMAPGLTQLFETSKLQIAHSRLRAFHQQLRSMQESVRDAGRIRQLLDGTMESGPGFSAAETADNLQKQQAEQLQRMQAIYVGLLELQGSYKANILR